MGHDPSVAASVLTGVDRLSHRRRSVRHWYHGSNDRHVTMDEPELLTRQFEGALPRLRAVAYAMLGSHSEADDAVEEACLRFDGADTSGVENLVGWLTPIVARVCLDRLRLRPSQHARPVGPHRPEPIVGVADDGDHEQRGPMTESVGSALVVVLDLLEPAERVAFVLHDIFAVSFHEIAPIVGRSPETARQLARRARRRVQHTSAVPASARALQREIVEALLAASRDGDFDAVLALLDPEVMLRADDTAVHIGAPRAIHGAAAVAIRSLRGARAAHLALVDGAAGLVWAPGGSPWMVFNFTLTDATVVAIDLLADPERIRQLDILVLDD
jgi:RNA polymerase sigma-70 factor, ECF subfamily